VDPTRAPGRSLLLAACGLAARAEKGVLYILFVPAGAVLSTLIYYRITAARAAALPN
jgi:hypothetical protein